jgi:hypothetical protein
VGPGEDVVVAGEGDRVPGIALDAAVGPGVSFVAAPGDISAVCEEEHAPSTMKQKKMLASEDFISTPYKLTIPLFLYCPSSLLEDIIYAKGNRSKLLAVFSMLPGQIDFILEGGVLFTMQQAAQRGLYSNFTLFCCFIHTHFV